MPFRKGKVKNEPLWHTEENFFRHAQDKKDVYFYVALTRAVEETCSYIFTYSKEKAHLHFRRTILFGEEKYVKPGMNLKRFTIAY